MHHFQREAMQCCSVALSDMAKPGSRYGMLICMFKIWHNHALLKQLLKLEALLLIAAYKDLERVGRHEQCHDGRQDQKAFMCMQVQACTLDT